ncbi:MAG: tetratricopeptide repeat protein, partial [Planctomycetota bacterium]
EAFKQAVRARADLAEAHLNLGITYGQLGRYQEAIGAFRQVILLIPDDADAHFGLGLSYLSVGDKGLALEEYKVLKPLNRTLANELFDRIYE